MSAQPPRQQTIERPVEAGGTGVHSGRPVNLALFPAPPESGLIFVRTDLPGKPEIPATLANIKSESLMRMTVLENKAVSGAVVGMIEHLLAACAGMRIDNLRIELDGAECPIFDGSGSEYARLLLEAGPRAQDAPRRRWRVRKPVALIRDHAEIIALPADRTRYTFFAEFHHAGRSDEQATFDLERDDFIKEIAPARTFCFWSDIEMLLKAGLIQGGSTDSAIVLKDGQPVRVLPDRTAVADPNFEFRLPYELARHKLLDLMGDLAILGAPVLAMISARASGHALHQEFARMLRDEIEVE